MLTCIRVVDGRFRDAEAELNHFSRSWPSSPNTLPLWPFAEKACCICRMGN